MILPIQVTFREIGPSEALEDIVRSRAEKLDLLFDPIMRCRVMVEVAHRHQRHGTRYHVRIDLTVPGDELIAAHDDEDLYACIDLAFHEAKRVLADYASRRRKHVKRHAPAARGRVRRLFQDDGYGFLETRTGEEVYFHENSVLHGAFSRLRVGYEVRFAVEDGAKGLQASTVELARIR